MGDLPIPQPMPDPTSGEERTWLDTDHFLEPVDPLAPEQPSSDPIVIDAAGRMWRLGHRPTWTSWLAWGGVALLALLILVGLFVLHA